MLTVVDYKLLKITWPYIICLSNLWYNKVFSLRVPFAIFSVTIREISCRLWKLIHAHNNATNAIAFKQQHKILDMIHFQRKQELMYWIKPKEEFSKITKIHRWSGMNSM